MYNYIRRLITSIIKSVIHCVLSTALVSFAYYSTNFGAELENFGMSEYVLKTVLLCLTTIPLYIVLTQYDVFKKAYLLGKDNKDHSFTRALLLQLRDVFFWLDALLSLILISLISWSDFVPLAFFPSSDMSTGVKFGWKILLYTFPMLIIFLISDSIVSRGWLKESELQAPDTEIDKNGEKKVRSERPAPLKMIIGFLFLAAAIWLLPPVMLGIFAFLSSAKVFLPYAGTILSTLAVLNFSYFLLRALSTMLSKKKFVKNIKKICADREYDLKIKIKQFKGLLYCTRKVEFIIKTPKATYSGTFIPVFLKSTILYFTPRNTYRFRRKILRFTIPFPNHKYLFETGDGEEKIVLLTKEPKLALYGDKEKAYYVYNGSKFSGVTVYDITAFCNYIDRM